MEQHLHLTKDHGDLLQGPSIYQTAYRTSSLFKITRPNIVYPVNILGQFMHEPRQPHYDAAVRAFQNL